VKAALESVYECLGVSCTDVGALQSTAGVYQGMEACTDADDSSSDSHDDFHAAPGFSVMEMALVFKKLECIVEGSLWDEATKTCSPMEVSTCVNKCCQHGKAGKGKDIELLAGKKWIPVADISACSRMCDIQLKPLCGIWSYNKETNTCRLKAATKSSKNMFTNGAAYTKGLISGIRGCQPTAHFA